MDFSDFLGLLQVVDKAQLAMVAAGTFLLCGGIFRVVPNYGDGFKWVVSTLMGAVLGWVFIVAPAQYAILFGGLAGVFTTYGVSVFKGKPSDATITKIATAVAEQTAPRQ